MRCPRCLKSLNDRHREVDSVCRALFHCFFGPRPGPSTLPFLQLLFQVEGIWMEIAAI